MKKAQVKRIAGEGKHKGKVSRVWKMWMKDIQDISPALWAENKSQINLVGFHLPGLGFWGLLFFFLFLDS